MVSQRDERNIQAWKDLGSGIMDMFSSIPGPVERVRAAAGARAPVDSTEGRVYRSDLPREQALLKERLRARNQAILQGGTDTAYQAPGGIGPENYIPLHQNIRPASPTEAAVGQRQRDAKIRAAAAPKETKEKVDPTTGDYEKQESMKDDQGNEIIKKSKGNKYQEQYEKLLQQQVDMQQRWRLKPLAQFVDQFTGSRLAPGFSDPNIAARQDLASRIKAAGTLYGLHATDPNAEFKRRMAEEKLKLRRREVAAKEAAAKKGKEKKPEDWAMYSLKWKRGKDDVVTNADLISALSANKGQISEMARLAGAPKRAVRTLEAISRRQSSADLKDLIAQLEREEANYLMDEGYTEEEIKRDYGNLVRNQVSEDLDAIINYHQKKQQGRD